MSSYWHMSSCICQKQSDSNELVRLKNENNERIKNGNIPSDLIGYHPRSPVINDRIVKRPNPSLSSKERHEHIVITTVHPKKPKFTKKL